MELTNSDPRVEDLIITFEHESGGNGDKENRSIISVCSVPFDRNSEEAGSFTPVLPETKGTLEWGTFTRLLGSSFRASYWTESVLKPHHLTWSLVRRDIPVGDGGVFTIWQ